MTDEELETLTMQGYRYSYDLDYGKAVECWRNAAEQGYALAQFWPGCAYSYGDAVPEALKTAEL